MYIVCMYVCMYVYLCDLFLFPSCDCSLFSGPADTKPDEPFSLRHLTFVVEAKFSMAESNENDVNRRFEKMQTSFDKRSLVYAN